MAGKAVHTRRVSRLSRSTLDTCLRLLLLLAFLFPILWMALASVKTQADLFVMPPKLFFSPTVRAYREVLAQERFRKYILNSLVVASASTALAMVFGTTAAYALERFRFKRRKDLGFWIISTRMAPPVVAIVPFFLMMRYLGLYDTQFGLILIYLTFNLPFAVWMMRGYVGEVPRELDEAAQLDGCSRMGVLRRVILPLVAPGFLATAVMSFIYSWNEFFFAYVLTGQKAQTLPVGIAGFITMHGVRWDQVAAVGTLVLMPVLVFGLLVQRYFVKGMVEGALSSY